MFKNSLIEKTIQGIQERLDSIKFKDIVANAADPMVPVDYELFNTIASRKILEKSVMRLENRGSLYRYPLERAKGLLDKSMFTV